MAFCVKMRRYYIGFIRKENDSKIKNNFRIRHKEYICKENFHRKIHFRKEYIRGEENHHKEKGSLHFRGCIHEIIRKDRCIR